MGVEAETALNRQGLPNTLCYYAFDMDITKGADIRLSELHPVGFPLRRNDANGAVAPPTVPTEPVPEPVPEPMPEPRTAAVSNGAAASPLPRTMRGDGGTPAASTASTSMASPELAIL